MNTEGIWGFTDGEYMVNTDSLIYNEIMAVKNNFEMKCIGSAKTVGDAKLFALAPKLLEEVKRLEVELENANKRIEGFEYKPVIK